MTYSKIIGDKEMERELRQKSISVTCNTNFGLDPEDEEVLHKIWSSHSNRNSIRRSQTAPAPHVETSVTIAQPCVQQRPGTVAATGATSLTGLPEITGHGAARARFIATGHKSVEPNQDQNSDAYIAKSAQTCRSKSARFAVDSQDRSHTRGGSKMTDFKVPLQQQSSRAAPNIFEEDTRPSLLDVHRDRVRHADYEKQVNALCSAMEPFRVDKEKVINDYYLVVLQGRSEETLGRSTYKRRVSNTTPSDMRRATGNPDVRSMTMKKVSWDFNGRSEHDDVTAVMPPMAVCNKRMSVAAW